MRKKPHGVRRSELRCAPQGVKVRNPAFDVTPAELITGIICEKGVVLKPDAAKIGKLLK